MKYKFWYVIHNLVAHPLLITGAKWADRFHDWTAEKMPREVIKDPQDHFVLPVGFYLIVTKKEILADGQGMLLLSSNDYKKFIANYPKMKTND